MANHTDDFANKLIFSGVHLELTPAMQNVMSEKFAVLLRHNEWIVRVNVRISMDQTRGQQHLYSGTAQIEMRGPDIIANVKGDDAYAVIDGLVEKLDEQLRERHERLLYDRRHPHDVEIEANIPKARGNA
jgi:putative sigma-54 modulation protein